MAEQLTDLLHDSVDPVDVPRPDVHAIAARGRTLRGRRRAGTVVAAALCVGALGIGGAVVADVVDGDGRGAEVTGPRVEDPDALPTSSAYDERGSWALGSEVTIGSTTVDLGSPVAHLAQTSVGVVARIPRDAGNEYVLVSPDGGTITLSIPSSVVHVEGDINHPRVAWLTEGGGEVVAHVWDVAADAEVGRVSQPLQGDEPAGGGELVLVPQLDGDDVYFGVGDDTHFRVDWARGGATVLPYGVFSVHRGIATVLEDPGSETGTWLVYDVDADRVLRRLERAAEASVSPSGEQVLTIDQAEDETTTSVLAPVAGGDAVDVPGVTHFSAWTPGGGLLSLDADKRALVRCDAAASCAREDLGGSGDGERPLVADYLTVG